MDMMKIVNFIKEINVIVVIQKGLVKNDRLR